MFSTSSEGRGQYGAAARHVGETVEDFVERSLNEGHQPDAIAYPRRLARTDHARHSLRDPPERE